MLNLTLSRSMLKTGGQILHRVAGVGLLMLLSNLARVGSSLLINRHILQTAGADIYGVWSVAQSAMLSVSVISDFGMSAAGARSLILTEDNRERYRELVISKLRARWLTGAAAALCCIGLLLASPLTHHLPVLVGLAATAAFVWPFASPWFFVQAKSPGRYYISEAIAFSSNAALLMALSRGTITLYMSFLFLSATWAIHAAYATRLICREASIRPSEIMGPIDVVAFVQKYGMPFVLVALPAVSTTAIVYFLGFRMPSAELGLFAFADKMQSAGMYAIWPFIAAATPFFVRNAGSPKASAFALCGAIAALAMIGLGISIVDVFLPALMPIMAGRGASLALTRIFGTYAWIVLPATAAGILRSWVLIPAGRYRELTIAALITVAVHLTFIAAWPKLNVGPYVHFRILLEWSSAGVLLIIAMLREWRASRRLVPAQGFP